MDKKELQRFVGTVKDLAEQTGLPVTEVNGFIKVSQALGIATKTGTGDKPKRGRAPVIYSFDKLNETK